MEGYCNNCGSSDVDVDIFSCSSCKFLYSIKDDDGRRYSCENEEVEQNFDPKINGSTIYKFGCNRYEQSEEN